MREVIHRVSGGLAALSAAVLATFATDLATRPTSWAVPVSAAVLLLVCNAWFLSRPGPARESREEALRAADKATFEDLTAMVDRDVVSFLKEHDFGASWNGRSVDPLYLYRATRNDVEHRFHDRMLEQRREDLHAAVTRFTEQLGQYSGSVNGAGGFELNEKAWVRSHAPGEETSRRFEAHRGEVNELADEVVGAYDELVVEARRRVP